MHLVALRPDGGGGGGGGGGVGGGGSGGGGGDRLFALKQMAKAGLVARAQQENVLNEKAVLLQVCCSAVMQ